MSRRGCDGGRKKGVIDSRRGVNCPVSDCDVSGRIDYVKKHFNNNKIRDLFKVKLYTIRSKTE